MQDTGFNTNITKKLKEPVCAAKWACFRALNAFISHQKGVVPSAVIVFIHEFAILLLKNIDGLGVDICKYGQVDIAIQRICWNIQKFCLH